MNKYIKTIALILVISILCSCKANEESELIESNEFTYGYELSLGYGLPSIFLEDDYQEWDLSDNYFGGKNADEAYIPSSNKNATRIVIYREQLEENLSLHDYTVNNIEANAYDKTQNISYINFDEETPYTYFSVIKEIDNMRFLAQEYFYKGVKEFVNLEYLTPLIETEIIGSNLSIFLPANFNEASSDGYIDVYYDEQNLLPSIYISKMAIELDYMPEQITISDAEIIEEIDINDLNYEDYISKDNGEKYYSVDYHEELEKYLNNMHELFDIEKFEYSSLVKNDNNIETLRLQYAYIDNETNCYAYELNIGIDQNLYTICFCCFDDNNTQKANAQLLLNSIVFN